MTPDAKLREESGCAWVMARLEPASPYGRALARSPRWYGPGEEAELEEELNRVTALCAALEDDPAGAERALHLLAELRDIRNSFHRPGGAPMDEVELFEVKHFLLCLERLAELPPLGGLAIAPLTPLLDLLDPGGRRLPPFSVEPAFEPSLEDIRREKGQLELALRTAEGNGREELLRRRRILVEEEDRAELSARRRLTNALLGEKEDIFAAMDVVGRLDFTLAKARLARRYGCVRPILSAARRVTAEGLRHPQVAARLEEEGRSFTPVSLTLEGGATVITGANMGGKSVSLRSVVLNLLLLQTGFFVFADALCAPLFASVAFIGPDSGSPEGGLSSFGAEVTALNRALSTRDKGVFFLALDEFARGTNPREGAALARALTEYLNGLDCVALLATHYDGVSEAARRHYQVVGLSLPEDGSSVPLASLMDYRLVPAPPGAPCPRDALRVCRLLGLEGALMELFEKNC